MLDVLLILLVLLGGNILAVILLSGLLLAAVRIGVLPIGKEVKED